jgi:lysozyme family protein
MPSYSELRDEYELLWSTMQIRPERLASVRIRAADILQAHRRQRYETVQAHTEVPWMVIACIHSLEADLSFRGHLHNGDPLTDRTVQVPAGRPRTGSPPFSWEDSAVDAIEMKRSSEISGWSLPECLFYFERYNGWGYRNGDGRHTTPASRSPYVWSFTTNYERGKYIRDHVFDRDAVSRQMGTAAVLRVLIELVGQRPADTIGVRNPTRHDRPIIRRGSRGEPVAELQKLLRDAGLSPGSVDGIFGGKTEAAVREFQQASGLEADGVVGPRTWDALIPVDDLSHASGGDETTSTSSTLRQAVLNFAVQEASKGRRHAPGNEIDRLVLDPLRPILKQLGHLGQTQDDVFFNWCASWVTYVCRSQGIRIPDRYKTFWASVAKVDAWRDMAMDLDAWFRVGTRVPSAGDIVVYNWDDDSDTDHIGILRELRSAQSMLVVCEGNRNNREVIAEDRRLSDVEGFIDLERLSAGLS